MDKAHHEIELSRNSYIKMSCAKLKLVKKSIEHFNKPKYLPKVSLRCAIHANFDRVAIISALGVMKIFDAQRHPMELVFITRMQPDICLIQNADSLVISYIYKNKLQCCSLDEKACNLIILGDIQTGSDIQQVAIHGIYTLILDTEGNIMMYSMACCEADDGTLDQYRSVVVEPTNEEMAVFRSACSQSGIRDEYLMTYESLSRLLWMYDCCPDTRQIREIVTYLKRVSKNSSNMMRYEQLYVMLCGFYNEICTKNQLDYTRDIANKFELDRNDLRKAFMQISKQGSSSQDFVSPSTRPTINNFD